MRKQTKLVIYTKRYCPFCIRAKYLLDSLDLEYENISVDGKPSLQDEMTKMAGARTVPQVFINDRPIGGSDDLSALHRANKLESLLYPDSE